MLTYVCVYVLYKQHYLDFCFFMKVKNNQRGENRLKCSASILFDLGLFFFVRGKTFLASSTYKCKS